MPTTRKRRKLSETPAKVTGFEAEVVQRNTRSSKKNIEYEQVVDMSAVTPHAKKKSRPRIRVLSSENKENSCHEAPGAQTNAVNQNESNKKPLSSANKQVQATGNPKKDDENLPLSTVFARSLSENSSKTNQPAEKTEKKRAQPEPKNKVVPEFSPSKDIENIPLSKVYARSINTLNKGAGKQKETTKAASKTPKETADSQKVPKEKSPISPKTTANAEPKGAGKKAASTKPGSNRESNSDKKGGTSTSSPKGQAPPAQQASKKKITQEEVPNPETSKVSDAKSKETKTSKLTKGEQTLKASTKLNRNLEAQTNLLVKGLNAKKRKRLPPYQDSKKNQKSAKKVKVKSPNVELGTANEGGEKGPGEETGNSDAKKKTATNAKKRKKTKEKIKKHSVEPPMPPLIPPPIPTYPTGGRVSLETVLAEADTLEPKEVMELVLGSEMRAVAIESTAYQGHSALLRHMSQAAKEIFQEVSKVEDYAPPVDYRPHNEMLLEHIATLRELHSRLKDEENQWLEHEKDQSVWIPDKLFHPEEGKTTNAADDNPSSDKDPETYEASIAKLSQTIEESIEDMVLQVDELKSNVKHMESTVIHQAKLAQSKLFESYESCQFAGYLSVGDPASLIRNMVK